MLNTIHVQFNIDVEKSLECLEALSDKNRNNLYPLVSSSTRGFLLYLKLNRKTTMNYEISNTISNHKYNEWEIKHRRPFKKGENCFIIEDKPINLYQVYKQGHSLKPHAFKDAKNAIVHSIVLDFDNLTKLQYDFVKSICQGPAYSFANIYGDDSAGMKTKRHAHELETKDIPCPVPFTTNNWKFKVFYGVEVLATYDEIYGAFLDAVGFFNPLHSMEEVKEVFDLWIQARNQSLYYKHDVMDRNGVFHKAGEMKSNPPKITIEDSRFNGFILPDVAMLQSFRHQITYGVDVNQEEKFLKCDENYFAFSPMRKFMSMSAFPSTSKDDYEGLDWKEEFDTVQFDKNVEIKDNEVSFFVNLLKQTIKRMESEKMYATLYFPYTKSMMARKLNITKFDDLVMSDYSKIGEALWVRILAKSRNGKVIISNLDEIWQGYHGIVQEEIRNAREYVHQAKLIGHHVKPNNEIYEDIVDDIVHVLKTKYGLDCFKKLDELSDSKSKTMLEKLLNGIARDIVRSGKTYSNWRLNKKLSDAHLPLSDEYMKHLKSYRETKDIKYLNLYNEERKRVLNEHLDEIQKTGCEYIYCQRGMKKRVIEQALFKSDSIDTKEEFVEWGVSFIELDLGLEHDEAKHYESRLEKWFKDYRREWNKTFGVIGKNTIRKEHKEHHSKWNEVFEGKSDDEILSIINTEVSSRKMRCYLKKQFLSKNR